MPGTDDLDFGVRDHEDQYSIWSNDREIPAGWGRSAARPSGTSAWTRSTSCGRTCARRACGL
ncbi:MbtH family NRPS accessory protein [Streptomyces hokutonensis]|uniref:MbtH family NRPS accessory protein n=1 Tax=Streptomyces hokutonensis TaxID=1306990 RepID=A0ABW6MCI5_9ACTN